MSVESVVIFKYLLFYIFQISYSHAYIELIINDIFLTVKTSCLFITSSFIFKLQNSHKINKLNVIELVQRKWCTVIDRM